MSSHRLCSDRGHEWYKFWVAKLPSFFGFLFNSHFAQYYEVKASTHSILCKQVLCIFIPWKYKAHWEYHCENIINIIRDKTTHTHTLFVGRYGKSHDSTHNESQIPGRIFLKMTLRSGPETSLTAKGVHGIKKK